MIIIGLTGGIGSGKTFVANEFNKLGIPVYNSDTRAKELMGTQEEIKKELTAKLGSPVFENGKLNRKFIADAIFTENELLNWMNGLIHPLVQKDFEIWLNQQHAPFVIKEAAILIESGAYKQCSKIIVVTALEKLRIERVVARDNVSPEKVNERIKNQISDVERLKYADFTINNDGTKLVKSDVLDIFNKIKQNLE
jgi:dephospho-CoA kinase